MKGSTKATRGPVKRAVTRNGVRKPKTRRAIWMEKFWKYVPIKAETIVWEIFTGITPRVMRVYLR